MIDREYGKFIPTCDVCGEILTAQDEFSDAVEDIKDQGWSANKIDGEWVHLCPDCQ